MRPSIAHANEQLDPRQQLASTPPPQSSTLLLMLADETASRPTLMSWG